jgi:hypothetical protein
MQITDRPTLGDLWTLWGVDRSSRECPVDIGREPAHNARQLRVREVECPAVWAALARQQKEDRGISSACNIGRIIRDWLREPYAMEIEAFELPDSGEWVVCEGNHTSCALYLLAPERFTVRVKPRPAWSLYLANPQLRS